MPGEKSYIKINLDPNNAWDREIINSLSRTPSSYAEVLLKAEILKWCKSSEDLTTINAVGLDIEDTLIENSPNHKPSKTGSEISSKSKTKSAPKRGPKALDIEFNDDDSVAVEESREEPGKALQDKIRKKFMNSGR